MKKLFNIKGKIVTISKPLFNELDNEYSVPILIDATEDNSVDDSRSIYRIKELVCIFFKGKESIKTIKNLSMGNDVEISGNIKTSILIENNNFLSNKVLFFGDKIITQKENVI